MKNLLLLLSIAIFGQINGQIINTVAGTNSGGFNGDGGPATSAKLNAPTHCAFDASGNLYISDGEGQRIRKVNTSGIITTIAGTGFGQGTQFGGYNGDGGLATAAELSFPLGIAIDKLGNIYFADANNNRIRMINASGIISTIAGTGTLGFSGDGGQAVAAELSQPTDIAFDSIGNLYIADGSNYRVRKVAVSGIITTVAGNGSGSFSGDSGQAINAGLTYLTGIALDAIGNIYISASNINRIRKINTSGIINTIAGTGAFGFGGDGGQATAAKFKCPKGLAVDPNNNIYIADDCNSRIRKVDPSGIVTTIAGNGTSGFSGDGGLATSAELTAPYGLAFDASGNLYFGDPVNYRVRKITNVVNEIDKFSVNNLEIMVYPNPTNDRIFVDANTTDKLNMDLYDVNGRHVFNIIVNDKENINVATLDNGIYTLRIETSGGVKNKKLIIVR